MAQPRHELKYFISEGHAPILAGKLGRVLTLDQHANRFGEYMVRSLYFDDAFNSAYHDKLSGVMHRDKYRIRIYNMREDEVFLERKRKRGDLIEKDSVRITRRLAERLMAGEASGLEKMGNRLLGDIFCEMRLNGLRPKVIVDYDREAYLHPAERVRITFDKRVRSGVTGLDLFSPALPTVPVLDSGQMVLEVKYNSYLPDYVSALLSSIPAERSAISKYVLCRRYAP